MINVNQITAQLARMPDQALQQYASMHKNDPYTVSLALAESNRRKEMRTAAQGQQSMGEQPKVVDQGIAGMMAPAPQAQAQEQPMPEDVGIGALPAPNMQGMAGGGIVAFGDGGDVPGYSKGGIPDITSMTAAEAKEYAQRLLNERNARAAFTPVPTAAVPAATPASGSYLKALGSGAMKAAGPLAILGQSLFGTSDEEKQALAKSDPVYAAYLAAEAAKNPAATAVPTVVTPGVDPTGGTNNPFQPATAMAPAPASAPAPAPAPAPGPAASRAPAAEKDFLTQQQALEKRLGTPVDKLRAEREAITTEDVKGRKEGIAALKADQAAELATMFKGQEARLGKREAALEKSKDTNTGMAFLEAGLAMMQSRGQGLAGIAEGASVGTKQYASGIKDIRAAQEKLDDARDRMEELRQNQASMNKREIRAEEKGIRDTVVQGKRDLLTGVEKATDKQTALSLAATASDVAAQGREAQMRSAERIAANSITRATMADERADARARLSAAQTLMKESGDMLSGPTANLLSDKDRAAALSDYNSAKATLQKLGGIAAAPAAATSGQPRPALGSFKG